MIAFRPQAIDLVPQVGIALDRVGPICETSASMGRQTSGPFPVMIAMRGAIRALLLAGLLAISASGCAKKWNWRGEGFGEPTDPIVEKLRPPGDASKFSGADARAREIESHLGVR